MFLVCLLPFAWLLAGAILNTLGANPAEALIRATGDWTLRALCLVLAVTPLRVVTSTPQLARFRRMLGLFVFFYGVLHLLSYAWFDMAFDLADILRDIAKRPFILVGSLALLLWGSGWLLGGVSYNLARHPLPLSLEPQLLALLLAAGGLLQCYWPLLQSWLWLALLWGLLALLDGSALPLLDVALLYGGLSIIGWASLRQLCRWGGLIPFNHPDCLTHGVGSQD